MAFQFGNFSLERGPFHFTYWFNGNETEGGEDRGAQFCMAHTLEGFGATLMVTEQGKTNTGSGQGGWLYFMKGYNAGPYSTHCMLQGGGMV